MIAALDFLSPQAQISLVIGMIVAVVAGRHNRKPHQQFNLATALTVMFAYLVIAYNSNCLVSGSCSAWSWLSIAPPVLTGILFLWAGGMMQTSTQDALMPYNITTFNSYPGQPRAKMG